MANEVEIRISTTNNANAGFEQVRRMVREVGQEAETSGRRTRQMGDDTDHTGRAAARAAGMLARAGGAFASMGSRAAESAQQLTGRGSPHAALIQMGAILTALPVLSQAAGAALVLGAGAGLSALGMKAAAADVEIRASFAAMKEGVSADLEEMAEPFRATLIRMPAQARTAFDDLAPSIRGAFAEMAPDVTDFMDDLSGSFVELAPAITEVSAKFGPMLDVLGDRMPDIMSTLGDSIEHITQAADPEALDGLIDAFNATVVVVAETIRWFETFGMVLGKGWSAVKDFGSDLKDMLDPTSAEESRELGASIGDVGAAAMEAASGVDELRGKLEQLAGQQLTAREATRAFEEAIDEATESARENGKTLDVNTKRGRANQKALDGIASSALEMKKAVEASGGDASEAMARARRQFISTAMGMGQSRAAAERLANRLGLVTSAANRIPKSKQISIKDNARNVERSVDMLTGAIRSMPSSKTVTVSFRTVGTAALDAARNLLNDIPGAAGGGHAHGGIIGAAGGGPRSSWTLVGEQGPELVKLAPGSTVHTAGATRSMLGGETQGHHQGPSLGRQIIKIEGAKNIEQVLLELLRRIIRTNGGDPVAVLTR